MVYCPTLKGKSIYKAKRTACNESIISGYRNVERYVRTKLRTKSFNEEFEISSSKKRTRSTLLGLIAKIRVARRHC